MRRLFYYSTGICVPHGFMAHGMWVFAGWRARFFACLARFVGLAGLAGLCACAGVSQRVDGSDSLLANWAPHALPGLPGAPTWQHQTFPGKESTRYTSGEHGGRPAVGAEAHASASVVRKHVHVAPSELAGLQFSWWVSELVPGADLTVRSQADASARLMLAFDGDRSRFSAKDAALSELVRALTGEEMPYATLVYVWSNQHPVGSVIPSTRTGRIRKLVVESGPGGLGRWLDYRRDVRADFERAFGEAPGTLTTVALMTDADNTRGRTRAWYGPMKFMPTLAARH